MNRREELNWLERWGETVAESELKERERIEREDAAHSVERRHAPTCKFRRSVMCPVGVRCKHGYDVCPVCDPCTCGAGVGVEDFA